MTKSVATIIFFVSFNAPLFDFEETTRSDGNFLCPKAHASHKLSRWIDKAFIKMSWNPPCCSLDLVKSRFPIN